MKESSFRTGAKEQAADAQAGYAMPRGAQVPQPARRENHAPHAAGWGCGHALTRRIDPAAVTAIDVPSFTVAPPNGNPAAATPREAAQRPAARKQEIQTPARAERPAPRGSQAVASAPCRVMQSENAASPPLPEKQQPPSRRPGEIPPQAALPPREDARQPPEQPAVDPGNSFLFQNAPTVRQQYDARPPEFKRTIPDPQEQTALWMMRAAVAQEEPVPQAQQPWMLAVPDPAAGDGWPSEILSRGEWVLDRYDGYWTPTDSEGFRALPDPAAISAFPALAGKPDAGRPPEKRRAKRPRFRLTIT